MIFTGTLSIHSSDPGWSLYLPSIDKPKQLLEMANIQIQKGIWNKDVIITNKNPPEEAIHTEIQIRKRADHLEIGPLIGILTVAGEDSFLGNKSNFIDIMATSRRMGALTYVICVEDINWEAETVTGYLFDHNMKKWLMESLPIPHIFYNRIPNRAAENQPHVIAALEKLSAMENITLYNPQFFEKSQLYHFLQQDEQVSHFLPDTVPFSPENLKMMVKKYSFLYIKPVNGKAGRGIYQLHKQNNLYILQYQLKKKMVKKFFQSLTGLCHILGQMLKEQYLIQQGISLATYQERIFDIRILAQKDGNGEWDVTGMGIRLAGAGGITTHVPRGGSIGDPKKILSAVFPDSFNKGMIGSVHKMVLSIAQSLENEWPALAECSMDIGIDGKGKMWFIEANSKPEKFDEPHIRKRSLQRIIEYAQYKSGFKQDKGTTGHVNVNKTQ